MEKYLTNNYSKKTKKILKSKKGEKLKERSIKKKTFDKFKIDSNIEKSLQFLE